MNRALRRATMASALCLASLASLASTATQEAVPEAEVVQSMAARRVRFEGAVDTVTRVGGGRFGATIEVARAPGGDLVVVNELGMQDYVAGIAEMPTRWPLEALKAQAVAARTYAWFEQAQGRWSRFGYDVCATTSCQVFRGRAVVETPLTGVQWQQAVDETEGEVLLHDGEPILARYFSTSGGRTWDNDEVFPGEGAFPYLKGVDDPDDATSPLHTWRVRFTRQQFDELLTHGQELSRATPLAAIRAIDSDVAGRTEAVIVTGADGVPVEVSAGDFRAFVSTVAPQLWPDEYPGLRNDRSARLPSTMPSTRFSIEYDDDLVVIDGRGWGHGVGMGQYGALGKAERGLDYRDILASYYGGLAVTRDARLPTLLRVGLSASRGEIPVHLDGPARLVIGDTVVTERALGTWIVLDGSDGSVSVRPPAGFGEALAVGATTTTRVTPNEVEVITLRTNVNKPVQLRLDVRGLDGALLSSAPVGVHESGAVEVSWSLDDVARRALPVGIYEVALIGTDEDGVEQGEAVAISVRPFVVATGADAMPATIWSGRRAVTSPLVVGPRELLVAILLGLLAGRLLIGLAKPRRETVEPPVAAT